MSLQYQSLVIPPHLLKLAGEEAVVVELPVWMQRLAPVKEEGPCLQYIGTTSKNVVSSYALPSVLHRSIFANGFIYIAGGKDSDDAYILKIFKMEPSAEGSWEEFAELDLEETESPYLIMYNN